MKQGTTYARKLKKAYTGFKGAAAGDVPESIDPIEQLVLAVLSQETSTAKAQRAMKQMQSVMVDYNDLRVSTPAEVSDAIARYVPRSVQRGKVLLKLLNAIYQREHNVSLDSLRNRGVREVKQYLESLEAITPYVSASVILWSLGGHAIPVSDVVHEWLVQSGLVHPDASAAEVQSFLERHISASEAKRFCLDLEAQPALKPNVRSNGKIVVEKSSAKKRAQGKTGGAKRTSRSGSARSTRKKATARKTVTKLRKTSG
jgi:endonuclease III